MDAKTIFIVYGLISLNIGLLLLFYIISNKSRKRDISLFASGKFIQAFALILWSSKGIIPDYVSANIGSSIILIALSLESIAIISFDNQYKKSFLLAYIIPVSALIILMLLTTEVKSEVVFGYYMITGYVFLFTAYCLFSKNNKTSTVKLVSFVYIVFGGTWIYAGTAIITSSEEIEVLTLTSKYEALIALVSVLYHIIGSVGYLLILKEADQLEILNKNEIIKSDNELLKAVNSKKDKFFSIIAHDLRGPIGNLISLGHILHQTHNEVTQKNREEMIVMISESAKKTSNLLENLLQWSRSETGALEVNGEDIILHEIVEENIKLYSNNILEKQLKVINDVDKSCSAFADRNMINTVVRNLFSNAIKFVHKQGVIQFKSTHDSNNKIVSLTISDNGVGIEESVVNKLFNIDNNHTTTGTNNERGTGLGLKLCKEFIMKNGGDITVESMRGKGSTFSIQLPIHSNLP